MFELFLFFAILLGQLGRIQVTPGVSVYAHDIVLAVFFMIAAIGHLRKKGKRPHLFLLTPFLIVLVVCFVSLLVNAYRFTGPELLVGAAYAIRLFLYFLLYCLVRRDQHTGTYWMRWLFWLGFAFSILGLAQLYWYPDLRNLSYAGWDPHYYRLFSTLFDPNFMGAVLLISGVAGAQLLTEKNDKTWIVIGISSIFVAFIFTFSRSSYVALIAAFLTYVFLSKRWKLLLGIGFFLAVIAIVPAIGGESTELLRQTTAFARITNWQDGIQVFLSSPIIGYGFNMIGTIPHNAPTLVYGAIARSASGYDNSLIVILVTTGLVGLGAFANLAVAILHLAQKVMATKHKELGHVYAALCIGLVVHSFFVNSLFYPQLMILFWIITAATEKEMGK